MIHQKCKKCKYFNHAEAKIITISDIDIDIICCCHPSRTEHSICQQHELDNCEFFEGKCTVLSIPGVKVNIITD